MSAYQTKNKLCTVNVIIKRISVFVYVTAACETQPVLVKHMSFSLHTPGVKFDSPVFSKKSDIPI